MVTKTKKTRAEPKPPSRKIADKAQFERFVEAARKAEMDEDPEAFDRVFDKVAPTKS
ncbi:MAG TPA: hypothetical protein VN808_18140 [Stellaceae bacterium]|nr:hypothetical protein [Stellaceae bacterium]